MGSEAFARLESGVEGVRVAGGHVTVLEAFLEHGLAFAVGDNSEVVFEFGRDGDRLAEEHVELGLRVDLEFLALDVDGFSVVAKVQEGVDEAGRDVVHSLLVGNFDQDV